MPAAVPGKRISGPSKQTPAQASARSPRQKASAAKRQVEEGARVQEWRRRLRSIARVQIGNSDGCSAKRRRACAGAASNDVSDVATRADLDEMRALLLEGEEAGLEAGELEQLRQALVIEETKAEVAEAARLADLNEATSDIDTLRAVIQEGKDAGLEASELKDARRALSRGVTKAKIASADLDALRVVTGSCASNASSSSNEAASSSSNESAGRQEILPTAQEESSDATSEALVLANLLEEAAANEARESSVLPSPSPSPRGSLLEAAKLGNSLEAAAPTSSSSTPTGHRSSAPADTELSSSRHASAHVSERTNSEQVAEFNRTFQIPIHDELCKDIFETSPSFAHQQIDLVLAEAKELEAGKARQNLPDIARSLASLVYTAHSVGLSFGLDVDEAFRAVHASNMSTLCSSEEEAKETVAWHRSQCPKGCPPPPLTVRKAEDGKRWMVQNTRTGEVLKSIRWQPVDLGPSLGY